jgi:hypothetical protein
MRYSSIVGAVIVIVTVAAKGDIVAIAAPAAKGNALPVRDVQPVPVLDCGTWHPYEFLHANEVGQAPSNYSADNTLKTGIDTWGPTVNSDQARASLVLTSVCQVPQATVIGLTAHLQWTGQGVILTYTHINDEDGVSWAPAWQGALHIPGDSPTERFDVDFGADMASSTQNRACQLIVGASNPISINIIPASQGPNEGHTPMSLAPGDYKLQIVCSPPAGDGRYFLWAMGGNVNMTAAERIDLDIVATYHQ